MDAPDLQSGGGTVGAQRKALNYVCIHNIWSNMLSKCVKIPILIEPDKLLRFFEILGEPFSMDGRLNIQSYAPVQERMVIETVYKSRVSDHLCERISCFLRFELQSKEKLKPVIVAFGKHSQSRNENVALTPMEQLDGTIIDLVVKEIEGWLQLAKAQVESEKLKTFYIVGRLRTPNCLPDGLYEFEDFTIFPLKEKSIDVVEKSGTIFYGPKGYQSGIFFKLEALSFEHATILANEDLHRYASMLSLLIRTEIGLDSNLKEISEEKEIEYNECQAKNGSQWKIDRSHSQRRQPNFDRKLKVPTDFEDLYKHYKMLNDKLRRKFENACSSYRLGLLEMRRHKEISQLAFISAAETLITAYPKASCGRKCPHCGEIIEKCHNEGYGQGFRDFISNYTNTPLEEIKKILNKSYSERGGTMHEGEFFKYKTQSPSPIREFITENGKFYPPHSEFRSRLEWLEMMLHTSIVNWLLSK